MKANYCRRILLGIGMVCCIQGAQATPLLDAEQAKAVAQTFVGIDISLSGPYSYEADPMRYFFEDEQNNSYIVHKQWGQVVAFSKGKRQTPGRFQEETWMAQPDVAREVIIQRATEFAKSHYSGFEERGLRQDRADLFSSSTDWNIGFIQILPENGAYTNNACSVRLSRKDGTIWSYTAIRQEVPPEAHRQPAVNGDQAKAAFEKESGLEQISFVAVDLIYTPQRRLEWLVKGEGLKADGEKTIYMVTLDADSGELLSKGGQMGSQAPGPKPPSPPARKIGQSWGIPVTAVCAMAVFWSLWKYGVGRLKH
ncbi:MAG: hypothetical protein IT210_20230 [Armatimonadetes bacterium]|nr:hypothetical protein [Armatimonadota bacterium]